MESTMHQGMKTPPADDHESTEMSCEGDVVEESRQANPDTTEEDEEAGYGYGV
jgi:hypothetical protein